MLGWEDYVNRDDIWQNWFWWSTVEMGGCGKRVWWDRETNDKRGSREGGDDTS